MINNRINGNIESGWFNEKDEMWQGLSLGLKVKKILLEQKSKFQDILVFESEAFGNVLVLDGVIQLTSRDEAAYQEMLAHLPLFNHPNPERVLIIGGGDLGILREVMKHNSIKETILCEIDEGVVSASKKFFPEVSSEFDNKKAKILIGDGAEYIKQNTQNFDVVIVDSSDPIGPANSLFTQEFYSNIKNTLNPNGILAIQGESLFLHKDIATNLKQTMQNLFNFADYAQVHVPTYPGGNIGLLICSDNHDIKLPIRKPSKELQKSLKYYSRDIHIASFVLPEGYKI